MKFGRILKALVTSFVISGLLLFLLAFALYRFDLGEKIVTAGVIIIYIISTLVGGLALGKMMKEKRLAWGLLLGAVYFILLILISLAVYGKIGQNGANLFTTFLLCIGGGIFGGMIS